MRVLLLVPPGLPGVTPNHEGSSGLGALESNDGAFRYPPHTVAAVAAMLRAEGHVVETLDAPAEQLDAPTCAARVLAAGADLIGVFVSWATREGDRDLLAALRGANLRAPLVAFGVSVAWMRDDLADADYLLEGEPELAIIALADALAKARSGLPRIVTPAVLGLQGHDAQGFISDLDALPVPAWDALPIARYPFLSVLSSRGCEARCSWCPYVVAQGRRWRARTPARVVSELREIVQHYHPKRIVFRDPAFAHDPMRVEAICRLILRDPILKPGDNLLWECESHPEHFNAPLLRWMGLAGCVGIKIGLETAGADILQREQRLIRADHTAYLAHIAMLARECARRGIACRLYAIAGLPGQTLADAQETADLARRARPAALSARSLKHYPGCPPSAAVEPSAGETRAQLDVLQEAQRAIAQAGAPIWPRWRRRLDRVWTRVTLAMAERGS